MSRFKVGDLVIQRNQPQMIGVVMEVRFNEQTERFDYLVGFGPQQISVPETLLAPFEIVRTGWEALRNGHISSIEYFAETITFHRLKSPTARIANAFSSARTQFYPHQFKPLLKFLENQGRGILIADDVGLGKTIEAGYILRELQARQNIERVIIIAPARLCTKWKQEMQNRFGEIFEIVKGDYLKALADRVSRGDDLGSIRCITSFESIRPYGVRKAIEDSQLTFDVLIVDECHRLRNPDTRQHKAGAVVSESSDFCIFLSATPVQNRIDDLWNVLKLLAPTDFVSRELFDDQMSVHTSIMDAQRRLSERPPRKTEARNVLNEVRKSGNNIVSDELVRSFCDELLREDLQESEIRELRSNLTQITPIGSLISRTRKVEAMPNCATRAAKWHPVKLSPAERMVYDGVEAMCRELWSHGESSWGFKMSLLSAYRMTASCIPAAVEYFKEKLQNNNVASTWEGWSKESAFDQTFSDGQELDLRDGAPRSRFEQIVEGWRFEGEEDSKYKAFSGALRLIWDEDDRNGSAARKIVVFSFYRRTLEYLEKRLQAEDVGCRMIHGQIGPSEREVRIDQFLGEENIRVLLTSEVGGEGIDLQKASVVINYDLPWNPMVVEQRIGRIDRIGQQAERLIIANLVIEGSIEETVLVRLLDKINIFNMSIGELDSIIGNRVEKLAEEAVSGVLSEEELKRRVEEEGNAIENQIQAARRILNNQENLIAADEDLIFEANSTIGSRLIPTENDLLRFLNSTFATEFPGVQIPKNAVHSEVQVDFRGRCLQMLENLDHTEGINRFRQKAANGPMKVTLARDVAYRHLDTELLHIRHPLVKLAVSIREKSAQNVAFSIDIDTVPFLSPGRYLFLISNVEFDTSIKTNKTIAIVYNFDTGDLWHDTEQADQFLRTLIENGREGTITVNDLDELQASKDKIISCQNELVATLCEREGRRSKLRFERQKAAKTATARLKVDKAQSRLEKLINNRAAKFAIKMTRAQLNKAERDLEQIERQPPPSDSLQHKYIEELIVGLLKVGG